MQRRHISGPGLNKGRSTVTYAASPTVSAALLGALLSQHFITDHLHHLHYTTLTAGDPTHRTSTPSTSLPTAYMSQNERSPLTHRVAASVPEPFARSGGYLKRAGLAASYPLRGIWYFAKNREYWPLFFSRLLPLSLISFLVYLILFTFAFLPQYAFLAIFHGWGAWVNAVVLVLGEGLVIVQGLFEGFFVDECRVDVFDATLIKLGWTELISPHRVLFPDAPTAVKMLGKPTTSAIYTPWSMIQILELVVFLPLNLIPWFGTPAFIIITGTRLGKLSHYRWFQLKGLSKEEKKRESRKLLWDDIWFGTVAMILELIPILSFFFLLTSTTGAAIWTARMERERRPRLDVETNPHEPDDPPPPYADTV